MRESPAIMSSAPASSRDQRVLIVDEISSAGETLRMAISAGRNVSPPEVCTATAFVRPRGYKPDYLVLETDQTIIFPWDRKIFQDNQLVANLLYQAVLDE